MFLHTASKMTATLKYNFSQIFFNLQTFYMRFDKKMYIYMLKSSFLQSTWMTVNIFMKYLWIMTSKMAAISNR